MQNPAEIGIDYETYLKKAVFSLLLMAMMSGTTSACAPQTETSSQPDGKTAAQQIPPSSEKEKKPEPPQKDKRDLREPTGTPAKPTEKIPNNNLPPDVYLHSQPLIDVEDQDLRSQDVAVNGWKIHVDADGLPAYFEKENGTRVNFSPEQLAQMKRAKTLAVTSQVPEVALVLRQKVTKTELPEIEATQPTREHPQLTEAPSDVVSEKEMSERGITIIQAKGAKFPVELFLKRNVFAPGSQFEDFTVGGDKHMIIVLVPGPNVAAKFMEGKPEYSLVIQLLDKNNDVEAFREAEIAQHQNNTKAAIARLQADRVENPELVSSDEIEIIQSKASERKERMKTKEELTLQMAMSKDELGIFFPESNVAAKLGDKVKPNTSVIFVSVGAQRIVEDLITISFDSEGRVRINSDSIQTGSNGVVPQLKHSFPNPSTFNINPEASVDNGKYAILGVSSAGLVIEHEGEHYKLIDSKGRPVENGVQVTDYNEYRTDVGAMSHLEMAWIRWVQSGYTDSSYYNFVFKTNQGFIMAKKEAPQKPLASLVGTKRVPLANGQVLTWAGES